MKQFRISVDVHIEADSREQASDRLLYLCDELLLSRCRWIVEVLPDGLEERIVIERTLR